MLFIILFLNPEYYSGSVIYNTLVPNLTAYHVQPKNIRLGAMVTSLLFYFSNIRPQRVSFCIYQVRAATAS